MSIDLSPFDPEVEPISIRSGAFKNYLQMGVHYGWQPLGLVYVSKIVKEFIVDEDGNEVLESRTSHYEDKRLTDKNPNRYLASDGHLFDEEDIQGLLRALSMHKEKDEDLVKIMSFLSQSKGVIIL